MKIRVTNGPGAGKLTDVRDSGTVIGRDPGCDVVLEVEGVSRRHARIFREGDSYVVEDLNSTNGVRVNGAKIAGKAKLQGGDRLGFGGQILLVTDEADVVDADKVRTLREEAHSRLHQDAPAASAASRRIAVLASVLAVVVVAVTIGLVLKFGSRMGGNGTPVVQTPDSGSGETPASTNGTGVAVPTVPSTGSAGTPPTTGSSEVIPTIPPIPTTGVTTAPPVPTPPAATPATPPGGEPAAPPVRAPSGTPGTPGTPTDGESFAFVHEDGNVVTATGEDEAPPAPGATPAATPPAGTETAPAHAPRSYVWLQSDPSGAMVEVDGDLEGQTPLVLSGLKDGNHSVRLLQDGYRPKVLAVRIPDTSPQPVHQLELNPGVALVRSKPSGMAVLWNDQFMGQTPYLFRGHEAGEYELKVVGAGYSPATVRLRLAEYRTPVVDVDLKSSTGTLEVTSLPSGATVMMDDCAMGRTPVEGNALYESGPLTIAGVCRGRHRVQLDFQGVKSPAVDTDVETDEVTTMKLAVWLPNTEVTMNNSKSVKGMIRRKTEEGDLIFAVKPDKDIRITADKIVKVDSRVIQDVVKETLTATTKVEKDPLQKELPKFADDEGDGKGPATIGVTVKRCSVRSSMKTKGMEYVVAYALGSTAATIKVPTTVLFYATEDRKGALKFWKRNLDGEAGSECGLRKGQEGHYELRRELTGGLSKNVVESPSPNTKDQKMVRFRYWRVEISGDGFEKVVKESASSAGREGLPDKWWDKAVAEEVDKDEAEKKGEGEKKGAEKKG